MTGIWDNKNPLIVELHKARMDFAMNPSTDTDVIQNRNLRLDTAIRAVEVLIDDRVEVADTGENPHPYLRLWRHEYHAHLATKKQMSESNSGIQEKLKAAEDNYTKVIKLLALERMLVAEYRNILGDKLDEVRAKQ